MPAYHEDRCTQCKLLTSPILLTIKRVVFSAADQPRKHVKQRAVAKLCEKCLAQDPDWNREAYSGPNNKSAPLERVREAQRGEQRG